MLKRISSAIEGELLLSVIASRSVHSTTSQPPLPGSAVELTTSTAAGQREIHGLAPADFLAGRTDKLSPLALGLSDGLTELEGNGGVQPAALIDAGGRFWFPSQRGLVRFDPAHLPLKRTPPPPVIDALEPAGEAVGDHLVRP